MSDCSAACEGAGTTEPEPWCCLDHVLCAVEEPPSPERAWARSEFERLDAIGESVRWCGTVHGPAGTMVVPDMPYEAR